MSIDHGVADQRAREGCVGTMNAERAIYFLNRFKRDEKMLGPHEQWALDWTIAALSHPLPQGSEAMRAALVALIEHADRMPKKTPAAGSCVTEHQFTIEAGTVWALDLSVQRARAALLPQSAEPSRDASYLICKGGAYYRPNAQGYTRNVAEAGRYTLVEAVFHSHPNGPNGPRDGITFTLAAAPQVPAGEPSREEGA